MAEFKGIAMLIAEALARETSEPDPHVIAQQLARRVPAKHLRTALEECLPDRVRIEITRQRMKEDLPPRKRTNGRSRWERFQEGLGQRLCVPGVGWKFLGDCDADDCDKLADDYQARADENLERMRAFRALANDMRAAGAVTVRDFYDRDDDEGGATAPVAA